MTLPVLPTRRLAGAIAVAGAAFLVDARLALTVNALLAILVIAEILILLREPLPRLRRTVPARAALAASVPLSLEVRSDAGRVRRMLWTDDPGPGLTHADDHVVDFTVPAASTAVVTSELRADERGRTHVGDMHVRILSPLGLIWRRVRARREDPLVVQPGLRELSRHRLLALHHRIDPGPRRVRELGEGREFERLREYVRGDDPRRIDWKATARHASPIVRQYEAERNQSIMLAIDAGRLMGERFDGRERLDHALAAGLVLADAAAVNGDSVGLIAFADTIQAFIPPARSRLSRMSDALASVETRRVEPDYPAAFRHLSRQVRRRSLVVLFTDLIDTRSSAVLLEHLAVLARRHVALVMALRNVELEDAAARHVATEADVFHRAASEELMQARAVALNTLRRRGVLVANVRPEEASGEVVARYVEIKRRGLL